MCTRMLLSGVIIAFRQKKYRKYCLFFRQENIGIYDNILDSWDFGRGGGGLFLTGQVREAKPMSFSELLL